MRLAIHREAWPFATPFAIARRVMTELEVVRVTIEDRAGHVGQGEAAGVDYDGETIDTIVAQIEAVADRIAADPSRDRLQSLLPHGGARNAVDCALWDLEAKSSGIPVWRSVGLNALAPLPTASTVGLATIEEMAAKARALGDWPLVKIKLDADRHVDAVRAVRANCPRSRLIVDPNQAWTIEALNAYAPELAALGVVLVEQPLPVGRDHELAEYRGPVALAADESVWDRSCLAPLAGLYDAVNIKLDKAGGLTEALALKRAAKAAGLKIMVGCMAGTSLAMAPGMIVAQGAEFVDLDGPLLHSRDRDNGIAYAGGIMSPPDTSLWG